MKAMVLRNICNFCENKESLEMVNLPDSVSGEREINSVANVASLSNITRLIFITGSSSSITSMVPAPLIH